jgi:DNA helicase-2/ATP-dependent DNA helicase PcrA
MNDYSHAEALDEEQLAAVQATGKAISVLAGPGSGKTRTLAHRARHLLLEDAGSRALLLTFTNKAAAEMKHRALGVGDIGVERLEATTFHGFGAKFLRSHGNLVGIDDEFDILDAAEREEFAVEIAASAGVPNQATRWSFSRLRHLEAGTGLAAFGDAFEAAKRAEDLVDFDDLVVYTGEILEQRPEIAAAYAARFQHVLVDEFQDTNPVQFSIVKAMAPHVSSISVFADDDQAIMRFAGAEAANVHRFTEELGAEFYPLTCNYRSREEIVEHANRLIAADPDASGRQMRAEKDGGTVELGVHGSTTEEAVALGREIADLVLVEKVNPAEIAILVRSGPRADEVVEILVQQGVPLTDWRGAAYETEERRMMITCFATVRAKLRTRHASRLSEMIDVELIEERDTHRFLETHAESPVAAELLALREQALGGASPTEIARHAQAAIAAYDVEAGERAKPLLDAIADFEAFDPEFSLDQLMAELALKHGGRSPTQGGGVKAATLHGTKGLQWPRVYMLGMEDGKLPDYRAEQEGTMADERRTCFVGVCRAEDHLVFSYCRYFRTFKEKPSRFLAEMGL